MAHKGEEVSGRGHSLGEVLTETDMDDLEVQGIYCYRKLSETILTAGQPSESELEAIARSGYEVVVNLGLLDQDYSLPDEKRTVTSLGLEYIHLPVIWEHPTRDDLTSFFEVMDSHSDHRLFVHCAANKRASIFVALYRIVRLGWEGAVALAQADRVGIPRAWEKLIGDVLRESRRS